MRVGILYPGYAAEDDYPHMAGILSGVHVEVVHTSVGEDAHRIDALLDIGSSERLIEGAQELKRRVGVDAAIWACTSGSFVFGLDGAAQQTREIEEFLCVPSSSTSIAFVEAVRSLGVQRVAIAATYPEDVAQAFAHYLGASGIDAVSLGSQGIVTAAEVGTLGREHVVGVRRCGRPSASAGGVGAGHSAPYRGLAIRSRKRPGKARADRKPGHDVACATPGRAASAGGRPGATVRRGRHPQGE